MPKDCAGLSDVDCAGLSDVDCAGLSDVDCVGLIDDCAGLRHVYWPKRC